MKLCYTLQNRITYSDFQKIFGEEIFKNLQNDPDIFLSTDKTKDYIGFTKSNYFVIHEGTQNYVEIYAKNDFGRFEETKNERKDY